MSLTTLFVDMNAYFASVEQQERPELRGKPVAVVPIMTDSTCCIAASYEAKRYGIQTGMLVGKARRMCPKLRIIQARPEVYVRFHHAIVASVESCLPVHNVHSVDEMSCRLMGVEKQPQQAVAIARRIKQALRRDLGDYMRCSVGLGPNRLLAKTACGMHKPDGLVVITRKELPDRLYSLEPIDLPGIGPRMQERLSRSGIRTVRQLCALSEKEMHRIWQGVLGRFWWHWLRGHDLPDIPTHRRTVGHSHMLPPDLRNFTDARAVLVRLIHRAAARLRSIHYWARQMMVYVLFLPQGEWKSRAGLGLCQDTLTMLETFSALWEHCPKETPFQVGVTLFDLVANVNAPWPLFEPERRRVELARTMDILNTRYGAGTVYWGGMHGVRDSAPRRIAFTHIPRFHPPEM